MLAPLDGIRAKLLRAEEHLCIFNAEARSYIDSCNPTLSLHVDENTRDGRITFNVTASPPLRLSTLVGDCVHNSRSALDNLICALARIKKPAHKCHGIGYPICMKRDDFLKSTIRKAIPMRALTLIERLQPYNGGNLPPHAHPLAILNQLSNRDKHRAIAITSAYSRNTTITIPVGHGACTINADTPLQAGATYKTSLQIPAGINPGMPMKASGSAQVVFERSVFKPALDIPVNVLMRGILDFIQDSIIPSLEPLF